MNNNKESQGDGDTFSQFPDEVIIIGVKRLLNQLEYKYRVHRDVQACLYTFTHNVAFVIPLTEPRQVFFFSFLFFSAASPP